MEIAIDKPTLIVNLFGSPGAGKSTLAAGLFYFLKRSGVNCEIIPEFAKTLTWAQRHKELKTQPYVFGKQLIQIDRCQDQVECVITDSPILLSYFYTDDSYPASFKQSVFDIYNLYNNLNFFIKREKEYNPVGRNQTAEESDAISDKILAFLQNSGIDFMECSGNIEADRLAEVIKDELYGKPS